MILARRASGRNEERGVFINAAASAGSDLVRARQALRQPARGAEILNRQAALVRAEERVALAEQNLEALERRLARRSLQETSGAGG